MLAAVKNRAAVALVVAMTGTAAADGERTPMFGGALTYTSVEDRTELVGGQLELAWWARWVALAVEGAAQREVADEQARTLAVAGSARLLVATWLWPSLFEPRDVELGLELHAIAERTWRSRDDRSDALGFGVAVRMRGGSDWEMSSLLAESRLFVRVMQPREDDAAMVDAASALTTERGLIVTVGLGAAFGAGTPRYIQRFRLRSIDER